MTVNSSSAAQGVSWFGGRMNSELNDRKWYKSVLSIRTDDSGDKQVDKSYQFSRGPLGKYFMVLAAHEYRMLKAVEGLAFTPQAIALSNDSLPRVTYGLVEGVSIKEQADRNGVPQNFFPRLLADVKALHQHGVAHMDLGNSGNILVSVEGSPAMIDFGAALPLNRLPTPLRRWACRQDIVGVLKLWSRFEPETMPPELLEYYQKHYRKNVYTPKRFVKAVRRKFKGDSSDEGRSGLAITISVIVSLLVLMSMSVSLSTA